MYVFPNAHEACRVSRRKIFTRQGPGVDAGRLTVSRETPVRFVEEEGEVVDRAGLRELV